VFGEDFREVAHCGGQFKVTTRLGPNGERQTQFAMTGARLNPMAFVGLFALPQGVPVGMIDLRGIGPFGNEAPVPGCLQVFMGSDSEGRFGHECPNCKGYWRSEGLPIRWPITCPYCGARGPAHNFLTLGQRRYIAIWCELVISAIEAEEVGERVINFDEAIDLAAKDAERPAFYYSEEKQQTRFTCGTCGSWNDIVGRFGYCSNCGTRNDLQDFERAVGAIRERINRETAWDQDVKALVSGFDSLAQQYARQLLARVPMIEARRNRLKDKLFHNLKACVEDFRAIFGVDLLKGGDPGDLEFGTMMFARRHVYEHKGGVADARYVEEIGDPSFCTGELIRESKENAARLASIVVRMARNLHTGFHDMLPVVPAAIQSAQEWKRPKEN